MLVRGSIDRIIPMADSAWWDNIHSAGKLFHISEPSSGEDLGRASLPELARHRRRERGKMMSLHGHHGANILNIALVLGYPTVARAGSFAQRRSLHSRLA